MRCIALPTGFSCQVGCVILAKTAYAYLSACLTVRENNAEQTAAAARAENARPEKCVITMCACNLTAQTVMTGSIMKLRGHGEIKPGATLQIGVMGLS